MKTVVQHGLFVFVAFAIAASVLLTGCTDSVIGHEEPGEPGSTLIETNRSHKKEVKVKDSYDFITGSDKDGQDFDGHGTHIAGTIEAKDDKHGIVGVTTKSDLYNLKVLDVGAELSTVVAALEYVTARKLANPSTPMVVNI